MGYPVSIHAPVRERHCRYCRFNPENSSFNSRSREGATPLGKPRARAQGGFNSRSREGATCWACFGRCWILLFQFTLP